MVMQRESATGANLGLGARGELEREAGADQPGLTRWNVEIDRGVQIQTGIGGMGPCGQPRGRVKDA